MLQINTLIKKNSKFKTASIGCFLRLPLTKHNLAYANLLAHLQMNASLYFPTIRRQQEVLSDLYDTQFEASAQLFGKQLILSYLANFIEPTEILDPDYNYAEVVEKLALIIQHPSFNYNLLNLTQKEMLTDYRELMEEPANYALDKFFKLWYQKNPDYAETFMGSVAEIKAATPNKIELFSQSLRTVPTVVVGLAKYPQALQSLINAEFKQAGLMQHFGVKNLTIPAPKLGQNNVERQSKLQAHLLMGYGFKKDMTYQEQIVGLVLAQYLAGDQSSKLFTRIREKLGAAYAVEANNYANNCLFLINVGLDPTQSTAARKIIVEEINKVAAGKIEAKLLKKVKKALLNTYLIQQDQPNWYLERMLRGQLFNNYESFDRQKAVKNVTLELLSTFAQNLFLNESYILK